MVLDIDQFRPEKGGNPNKIKENQRLRYCNVEMVDKIVEADEKWRKGELLILKFESFSLISAYSLILRDV